MKCRKCNKETEKGLLTCESCREVRKARYRRRKKEAREKGLCTSCYTTKAEKGMRQCTPCLGKTRGRKAARYKAGLCIKCGKRKHRKGWRTCERCASMIRKGTARYKAKQQGLDPDELDVPEIKECEVRGCERLTPPFDVYCMYHLEAITEMKETMVYLKNRNDRQVS